MARDKMPKNNPRRMLLHDAESQSHKKQNEFINYGGKSIHLKKREVELLRTIHKREGVYQ